MNLWASGPSRREDALKFWLIVNGTRYFGNDGHWTRHYLFAKRCRTKHEAQKVARKHKGAALLRDIDFDAFPSDRLLEELTDALQVLAVLSTHLRRTSSEVAEDAMQIESSGRSPDQTS